MKVVQKITKQSEEMGKGVALLTVMKTIRFTLKYCLFSLFLWDSDGLDSERHTISQIPLIFLLGKNVQWFRRWMPSGIGQYPILYHYFKVWNVM